MATFATELKQAWRSLPQRKAYFLTCSAMLTLALGANAAMFAVVNATMMRPMPFATSGEVVHLFVQPPGSLVQASGVPNYTGHTSRGLLWCVGGSCRGERFGNGHPWRISSPEPLTLSGELEEKSRAKSRHPASN